MREEEVGVVERLGSELRELLEEMIGVEEELASSSSSSSSSSQGEDEDGNKGVSAAPEVSRLFVWDSEVMMMMMMMMMR